ncbi:MAG TPA: hypothetical protein VJ323_19140 [Bryobacteraceae bacterium]|nr:hypothetical protein [Bryobacteraceae bacterium]
MCWTCFQEYADAPVVNARVQTAFDLMAAAPSTNTMLLHVIVEDMNVEDYFLDKDGSVDRRESYDSAQPYERGIFDALAALSEEERATAVAMRWGYISRDGMMIGSS